MLWGYHQDYNSTQQQKVSTLHNFARYVENKFKLTYLWQSDEIFEPKYLENKK